MALMLRLRVAPPVRGQSETLFLMDGRQLWRVTVRAESDSGPLPDGARRGPVLRLACRAEPVFWDERPDPERPARDFTLWLADDGTRLPLRLEMPIGLGTVVVSLTRAQRGAALAHLPDGKPGTAGAPSQAPPPSAQVAGAAAPVPAGARSL